MNLKKWFFLFWSDLVIGGLVALAVGLILQFSDREFVFLGASSIGFNVFTMVMGGLMFSIISQMGFFAYLMVNYIANSIIRRRTLWTILQVCLTVIVLADLALLPYYASEGKSMVYYAVLPIVLLAASLAVAYWKVQMTNASGFVPTLFFMTVGTTLEAIPVLQMDNHASILFMMIPLFVCNAWQILQLHRLVQTKKN